GYYINGKRCGVCSYSCSTCDGPNADNCLSCKVGKYLVGKTCENCDENCESTEFCSSQNGCTKCKVGYYPDNKKCFQCSTIRNCLECSQTEKKCTKCMTEFEYKNGLCQCKDSMYQVSETKCDFCFNKISNCQSCESTTGFDEKCDYCFAPTVLTLKNTCVLCEQKRYYQGGECVRNDDGCSNQIMRRDCLKCEKDNYLLKGICIKKVEIPSQKCMKESLKTCEDCGVGITTNGSCVPLPPGVKYYINDTTLECTDNFENYENECVAIESIGTKFRNGKYYLCGERQRLNNENTCAACQDNSLQCSFSENKERILKCNEKYSIDYFNETCFIDVNCKQLINGVCVKCEGPISKNRCSKCESIEYCKVMERDCKCDVCDKDKLLTKNSCIPKDNKNCKISNGRGCTKCENRYFRSGSPETFCKKENETILYAKHDTDENYTIMECMNGYYLSGENTCKVMPKNISPILMSNLYNFKEKGYQVKYLHEEDHCETKNQKGCLECSYGYFLKNYKCLSCPQNCTTCYSETICLSCIKNNYLTKKDVCEDSAKLGSKCDIPIPGYIGCAICKDGFFKLRLDCEFCDKSCKQCHNNHTCISCADNYYSIPTESSLCQPYSSLLHCAEKTQLGCAVCDDGYYLRTVVPRCTKCPQGCSLCSSNDTCQACKDDYVLINEKCNNIFEISFCKAAKNSVCTSCEGLRKPNEIGTRCIEINKALFISLLTIGLVIFVSIIIAIIGLVIAFIMFKRKEKKKMKNICIFDMDESNVNFTNLSKKVSTNKPVLHFENQYSGGKIEVGNESKELICIGNMTRHRIKIQMKVKENTEKYTLKIVPQVISLKRGEACEFEVFLLPNYTCNIEDKIACVCLDFREGKEEVNFIKLMASTESSCRLDYDELDIQKKLGEGSFGIVFKGTYRGNDVAIKKMKAMDVDQVHKLDEFEKEVAMLEKFKCEYIVHFYGACFIPGRVCMVTEFAPFGSLQDVISKKSNKELEQYEKVKIMIDAARGILYLHSNGILHRDIKPDNILVFSLNFNANFPSKLTDFGSSRNINMMMTNMTFTKGIGTPTYMAPEILKLEKYTMSSDIFSFGITMYECFGWCEAYPKNTFKFPWKIAEFVTTGERLPIKDNMSQEMYEIITKCWEQKSLDRIECGEVVEMLVNLQRNS
ncbi:protein kinase domain containing protein, partial [Entamoeba invadens IP1]